MDSRDCRKKRAKQNFKKCESSYVRELDSSDDKNNQDDISKFKFHSSTISGDVKQNIDEQFVKLEKCFNISQSSVNYSKKAIKTITEKCQ